jgi:hypothetical protein
MFPVLEPFEIERVRRFGLVHLYDAGAALVKVGEVGPGLTIILAGQVEIARRDELGHSVPIVTYGPGSFMGELAQLSGRPTLIDAQARTPVEALIISPDKLRALLIAEAELGERIMRALILRRVGLLETGAGGPVIVGRAGNGDVLRLEGFLRRNGHPRQRLDPDTDPEAKTLIERFHVDPGELPIVLCPSGELLRNPSENELARCIGLVGPIDPSPVYDVAIVGAGPAGRNIFRLPDFKCCDFEAECARRFLDLAHLQYRGGTSDVGQDRKPAKTRHDLAQEFKSFGSNIGRLVRHARDIGAWPRQRGHQAGADRIACHEHDRDERGRLLCRDHTRGAPGDDDVDFQPHELGSCLDGTFAPTFPPSMLDRDVAPLVPAEFA